jgi:hypothetical protein
MFHPTCPFFLAFTISSWTGIEQDKSLHKSYFRSRLCRSVHFSPYSMADDSTSSPPIAPLDSNSPSGTETMEVIAPTLSQAERVDKFLMNKTKLSRTTLQRLFEQERILVNGIVCKKSYKVCFGCQYRYKCRMNSNNGAFPFLTGKIQRCFQNCHRHRSPFQGNPAR